MSISLASKRCEACHGGIPPLSAAEASRLFDQLDSGWKLGDGHHLEREYRFPDFQQALAFVNAIGQVAEAENHHPEICLAWGRVRLTLWTHAVDALTEGDFILAAKVDALLR